MGDEHLSANAPGSLQVGSLPCQHFVSLQDFSLRVFFHMLDIKSHLKMCSSDGVKSKFFPVLP